MMSLDNMEGTFPIELWRLFVEFEARLYGCVSRLSKRHYNLLVDDMERYKTASCRLIKDDRMEYWTLPNGLKHGKHIICYGGDYRSHITDYVDGKRHGKYMAFYRNGVMSCEVDYVNDMLHGKLIYYHSGGIKTCEIDYIHDKQHGKWIDYDIHGNVISEVRCENGVILNAGYYFNDN